MSDWRLARSLATLRDQVTVLAPHRRKDSDGTIGDIAHATRKSEHNPDANGVVRAIDFTHDPAGGFDAALFAEKLRSARDLRLLYMIHDGRICSSVIAPWTWRPYKGANPHKTHIHISVVEEPALYDDTSPWNLNAMPSGQNIPPLAPSMPGLYTGITATVFGGPGDEQELAYGGHTTQWNSKYGCALPARFQGKRPKVRVWHGSKGVDCDIIDVGPWNTNDPYWLTNARPQAETGTDRSGRHTNLAGIDLTQAAAAAIGLDGKGIVSWQFVEEPQPVPTPVPPLPVPPPVPMQPSTPTLDPATQAAIAQAIAVGLGAAITAIKQNPGALASLAKLFGSLATGSPFLAIILGLAQVFLTNANVMGMPGVGGTPTANNTAAGIIAMFVAGLVSWFKPKEPAK